MIQYESRIRIVGYESKLFGVRICGHDTVRIHGFVKRIHVFTNLLYDSRILIKQVMWGQMISPPRSPKMSEI